MPCFKHERSLSFVPRRDRHTDRDPLAPKPVHPRALENHGLFGVSFVQQHLMVDERWSPNSLADQFAHMTEMLERRAIFKGHESKGTRQRYLRESKRLKLQCRLGRTKLQNIMVGDNNHNIRNFLIKHKDMQRLYQRMPIDLVADNINQRTFVMRKERDRLECRLDQLKDQYREMLMDRAMLENRIKYQNEFELEEEMKSRNFIKRIENSNVRIKAIKAINTTYTKMIKILQHDAIFYDPILRSLDGDMEDQASFIKHILYLGMPAIAKFKELNQEYCQLEKKSHESLMNKHLIFSSFQKQKADSTVKAARGKREEEMPPSVDPKRYLRETRSMLMLKNVLKVIENIIREVKIGTLSAQAREIYPRMKTQTDHTERMRRMAVKEWMTRESIEIKMNTASVLEGVLINNLSDEEIGRLDQMEDLKKELEDANKVERETLAYIKYRADAFVMLRVSLWNLIDILGHVDRNPKAFNAEYQSSYLKLPLLKFEMLNMVAVQPESYIIDVAKIMSVLKRKVYKVMEVYNVKMEANKLYYKEKYHAEFLDSQYTNTYVNEDDHQGAVVGEAVIQDQKTIANVPSRKNIKALSYKVVEDALKQIENA